MHNKNSSVAASSGNRHRIRLGQLPKQQAETLKHRIETLAAAVAKRPGAKYRECVTNGRNRT